MANRKKRIVTIGGGSGQFALLSGLRDLDKVEITAVVSMADSGGSTGRLRDELGVLPPGDVLKCLLALSRNREIARTILQKRFQDNSRLNGHSAGNMLLAMLSQYAGDFPSGVRALGDILDTRGTVLPITTDRVTLVAELTDGTNLYGESAIDLPRGQDRKRIKRTFLVPHHGDRIKVYPPVVSAIKKADLIIVGPGDLYTSITPNFLIQGVPEALQRSPARISYILNIMTKYGETDDFSARDFIRKAEKSMGRQVDTVVANNTMPGPELLKEYRKQKAQPVRLDVNDRLGKRRVVKSDVLSQTGGIIRHDPAKLSDLIVSLL